MVLLSPLMETPAEPVPLTPMLLADTLLFEPSISTPLP